MKPQVEKEWQIGNYRIQLVIQDWFWLWGEILWGGIPVEKWKEMGWHNTPFEIDRRNRIKLAINCFLIENKEDKDGKDVSRILVDTSVGRPNQWTQSTREDFSPENGFNLFAEGLPRPNIVIPTHLHFDHALGCAKLEDGKLAPAFPDATYIFHEDELSHIFPETHPMTRSSYRRETIHGVQTVLDHHNVWLMRGEELEIEPGITLIRTRGHTPGHLAIKIESEGQTALIPGALFPTRHHALIACKVANDTHPLEAAEHKTKFLMQACEGNWLILLEHDPDVAFRVDQDEKENYTFIQNGKRKGGK